MDREEELPEMLSIHALLLHDDEVIKYTDEEGEVHVFANHPIDETKEYIIIEINYSDL